MVFLDSSLSLSVFFLSLYNITIYLPDNLCMVWLQIWRMVLLLWRASTQMAQGSFLKTLLCSAPLMYLKENCGYIILCNNFFYFLCIKYCISLEVGIHPILIFHLFFWEKAIFSISLLKLLNYNFPNETTKTRSINRKFSHTRPRWKTLRKGFRTCTGIINSPS
jgi:hypothetical protein